MAISFSLKQVFKRPQENAVPQEEKNDASFEAKFFGSQRKFITEILGSNYFAEFKAHKPKP